MKAEALALVLSESSFVDCGEAYRSPRFALCAAVLIHFLNLLRASALRGPLIKCRCVSLYPHFRVCVRVCVHVQTRARVFTKVVTPGGGG